MFCFIFFGVSFKLWTSSAYTEVSTWWLKPKQLQFVLFFLFCLNIGLSLRIRKYRPDC
ncbi:hypothetical protein HanPSC8_Chr16g0726981 [Helianthus annuus]|nr:hypothetical protein HanPSC8_Chr16g0726981 [Helianthus annuus]